MKNSFRDHDVYNFKSTSLFFTLNLPLVPWTSIDFNFASHFIFKITDVQIRLKIALEIFSALYSKFLQLEAYAYLMYNY